MRRRKPGTDEAQDNVTVLPVAKQKRRQLSKRLLGGLLVLAVGATVALNWHSISPEAAVGALQAFLGEFGASVYPVAYPQGTLQDAGALGTSVAAGTDSALCILSPTGRQVALRQHGMTNPRLAVAGGNEVLYDAGGTTLRTGTRFSEGFSTSFKYAIFTAATCRAGYVAAATASGDYVSEMAIFSSDGKQLFKWYSSVGRILSLDLSPDGSHCAASVVYAKGGVEQSDIYIFDRTKKDPVAVVPGPGTLYFSVRYRDGRIVAVGDNKTVSLNDSGGDVKTYDYASRELKCYWADADSTLLAFSRYGVGRDTTLVLLGRDAKETATAQLSADARCVASGAKGAAVLCSDGVHLFDEKLKAGKTVADPAETAIGDADRLLVVNDAVYLFTPATVYRYALGG